MSKKPARNAKRAPQRVRSVKRASLDPFDRKIILALTENARASNVQIADRVGLSEAPCSRRIRRLEEDGIIRGYSARLDPEAVGIGFVAFVTLVLDYVTAATAERFYQEIRAIPEVMSCYIVSGGYDALLHVAATDSHAYSDIVFNRLRRIPGVKDVRSSFVMRAIKESASLPLIDEPTKVGLGAAGSSQSNWQAIRPRSQIDLDSDRTRVPISSAGR